MKFKNPLNDYTEETSEHAWFWTLIFGVFYFAVKGIWTHAVVSLCLAMLTLGFSWLIYPFFAKEIVRKHYLKKGWIEEQDLQSKIPPYRRKRQ